MTDQKQASTLHHVLAFVGASVVCLGATAFASMVFLDAMNKTRRVK